MYIVGVFYGPSSPSVGGRKEVRVRSEVTAGALIIIIYLTGWTICLRKSPAQRRRYHRRHRRQIRRVRARLGVKSPVDRDADGGG